MEKENHMQNIGYQGDSMVNLIIFPSGYFDAASVDEDLQQEYEAALATGLFDVVIFGYEKWFQEGNIPKYL